MSSLKRTSRFLRGGIAVCTLLFLQLSGPGTQSIWAEEEPTLCATVKIEIRQELTLERQAFEAKMRINNGFTHVPLEDVSVAVSFEDETGLPVLATSDPTDTSASFFISLESMTNIADIAGGGTIAPEASADISWLIIPAPGAAGEEPWGTLYYVGAALNYSIGGEEYSIEVSPDYIYVKPMPELVLDYFLPYDVYGDDAFTAEIEPPEPFSLGVVVENAGYGIARKVNIDSAQPEIVDNSQGLLVEYHIDGCEIDGVPCPESLLADFGTIQPGARKLGRWNMTTSLSGRFVDFTAEFTHSNELGGELTSLITEVNTHTLIGDVLVDLPGRDDVLDFLASDIDGMSLYESDTAATTVTDQSAAAELTLESGNRYILTIPATAGPVFAELADPFAGTMAIEEIVRSDGKRISPHNGWLAKTREGTSEWEYLFRLFDVNTQGSYRVEFTTPPDAPHAPVLQAVPDRSAPELFELSFLVEATDADGTVPTLTVSQLPAGAEFLDASDGTGSFSWTPDTGQAGEYELVFTATDGELSDREACLLTVHPGSDADGDGMDDSWEELYFGDTSRSGNGDFDGDGVSDLDEYLAGSNPDSASVPSLPVVVAPADGDEIATLQPVLSIENSTDGAGNPIEYRFELLSSAGLDAPLASARVPEDSDGNTEWECPFELEENGAYLWRVRAVAGTSTDWVYSTFVVNTENEPPGPFRQTSPSDGATIAERFPVLSITNSTDPDGDSIVYAFELFADSSLTEPLASRSGVEAGNDGTTSWRVDIELADGVTRYWRVTATDQHGLATQSPPSLFHLDSGLTVPDPPLLVSPPIDATVGFTDELFSGVELEAAGEGYHVYEIDTSPSFGTLARTTSNPIPVVISGSSWLAKNLWDNTRYFWRVKSVAYSHDSFSESGWNVGSFLLNIGNDAPGVPPILSPAAGAVVETLRPTIALGAASDPDGDEVSYRIEVCDDAACTNAISEVLSAATSAATEWVVDTDLVAGTTYYLRCRAEDTHQAVGSWSEVSSFSVADDGVDVAPSIELLAPDTDLAISSGTVEISWKDSDLDSDAEISLFYATSSGVLDTLIVSGISEDEETDRYSWDVSAVPEGVYYLGAQISDGTTIVDAYAAAKVTIDTTPPEVTVDPEPGPFLSPQIVTLSANEPARIFYTLDGSAPDEKAIWYDEPFSINGPTEFRCVAIDTAGNLSVEVAGTYQIEGYDDIGLTDQPEWSQNDTPVWSWTAPTGVAEFEGFLYRLDDRPEVFTTDTTWTAPALSDGEHEFAVRLRFTTGLYGEWNIDHFGVDTTAPVLTVPPDITVFAEDVLTTVAIGKATVTDISPVILINDSGGAFPVGTTDVTWTAADAAGNTTSLVQRVTVISPDPAIIANTGSLEIAEGGTASLFVRLSANPGSDLIVAASRISGDTDITISGGDSLTFTTETWMNHQEVVVSAAEDGDNADGTATLRLSAPGLTTDITAIERDNDLQEAPLELYLISDAGSVNAAWVAPPRSCAGFELVRNADHAPTDPEDGTSVYRGSGTAFRDDEVSEGGWYYSVFSWSDTDLYSDPRSSTVTVFVDPDVHTVEFPAAGQSAGAMRTATTFEATTYVEWDAASLSVGVGLSGRDRLLLLGVPRLFGSEPGLIPRSVRILRARVDLYPSGAIFSDADATRDVELFGIGDPDELGAPAFGFRDGHRMGLDSEFRDHRPGMNILWTDDGATLVELLERYGAVDGASLDAQAAGSSEDPLSFDITELCREWQDAGDCLGLAIASSGSWEPGEYVEFSGDDAGSPDLQPMLSVTYTPGWEDPPEPVGDLAATPLPGATDLSWSCPPLDCSGVKIVRKAFFEPVDPYDGELVYDGYAHEWTDGGLVAGTTYHYAVFAYDAERDYSEPRRATVTIGAPGRVAALRAATGNGYVRLGWTHVEAADGYRVYRSYAGDVDRNGDMGADPLFLGETPAAWFEDRHVGTEPMVYSVVAVNAHGESPAAESGIVTPGTATAVPAAPADIMALAPTSEVVVLDWESGDGTESEIVIERRETSGSGIWNGIARVTFSAAPWTDDAVVPGGDYEYRLTGINSAGASDASTPVAITVPDLPLMRRDLSWRVLSSTTVLLEWSNPADHTGSIDIDLYDANGEHLRSIATGLPPETVRYRIEGLEAARRVLLRVTAHNSTGSTGSDTEIFETTIDPKHDLYP